ncbi:MAG: carboxypeptidase regulatory-like domain-containing protein [Planctomycetales bacterium]|nr:carboxypeptidase regulatory-like domain-containing protein [Planctomycetales bacterium]
MLFSKLKCLFVCGTLISLSAFAGCGDPGIGTVPVKGKVLVDGNPLEGVVVVFNPSEGSSGRAASGRTDAQGIYALTTVVNGDGALPGDYKISVSKYENEDDGLPKEVDPNSESSLDDIYGKLDTRKEVKSKNFIAEKYSNHFGSGLTATVSDSGENNFDFNVEGSKKK